MELRGGLFNGSPFDGNKSAKEIDPSQTRLLSDEVVVLSGISLYLDGAARENAVCTIDEDISKSGIMIIQQRSAKIRHEGNITCLATGMSTQQKMIIGFLDSTRRTERAFKG